MPVGSTFSFPCVVLLGSHHPCTADPLFLKCSSLLLRCCKAQLVHAAPLLSCFFSRSLRVTCTLHGLAGTKKERAHPLSGSPDLVRFGDHQKHSGTIEMQCAGPGFEREITGMRGRTSHSFDSDETSGCGFSLATLTSRIEDAAGMKIHRFIRYNMYWQLRQLTKNG